MHLNANFAWTLAAQVLALPIAIATPIVAAAPQDAASIKTRDTQWNDGHNSLSSDQFSVYFYANCALDQITFANISNIEHHGVFSWDMGIASNSWNTITPMNSRDPGSWLPWTVDVNPGNWPCISAHGLIMKYANQYYDVSNDHRCSKMKYPGNSRGAWWCPVDINPS